MRLISFFIVYLVSLGALSQSQTIKVSVYFDTDKYFLRTDAQLTLNTLLDSIAGKEIETISISGNTDNRATNIYNETLSLNRSKAVQDYLKSKGIQDSLLQIDYFGEVKPLASNTNEIGMQKNRRVDIELNYRLLQKIEVPIIETDPCDRDTTLILKNGTQLVFNLCEYLEKKDCMEFTEVSNTDDAVREGLSTVSDDGFAMASCGMIGFGLLAGENCNNLCFKQKVKIRLLVSDEPSCVPCGRRPILYSADANGNWEATQQTLERVEVSGKQYYEYELGCLDGKNNCDCKIPTQLVKFKAPRGYTICNLTLTSDCPFGVYPNRKDKEKRDHVYKKRKLPCFVGGGDIRGTLINKNGDTLILRKTPLVDLDKFIWFARCKVKSTYIEKKIFRIFPFKRRWLYRKYRIKEDDLIHIDSMRTLNNQPFFDIN